MFFLNLGNIIIDLGELKDEMSLNKYQEGKVKGIGGDMKTDILKWFFFLYVIITSFVVRNYDFATVNLIPRELENLIYNLSLNISM